MTIDDIKSIGVLGAGTMGQGIAEVCASSGYKVLLYDIRPELITTAIDTIRKSLETKLEKKKITADQKEKTLNLLNPVFDFSLLQADLVIEAVIEDLEAKQKLFTQLENFNRKDCILATNTSSISVTQIAASLKHEDRFAGLHFFNPAPVMKLVEIVKGSNTADSTVAVLSDLSRKLFKEPVVAQDSPGFIVNRVARHYYLESLKVLEEKIADINTVDNLLRASGFKMGPFELMDLIGIDINLSVTTSIYNAFNQHPRFKPSNIQQTMAKEGHLGRKTGKGFYDYERE